MAILIEKKRRRRRKAQTSQNDVIFYQQSTTSIMIPPDCAHYCQADRKEDDDDMVYPRLELRPQHGERLPVGSNGNNNQNNSGLKQAHCKLRLPNCGAIRQRHSLYLLLLLSIAFTLLTTLSASNLIKMVAANANALNSNQLSSSSSTSSQLQQQLPTSQLGSASSFAASQTTSNSVIIAPQSSIGKARYKTMYACEDRQLTMDCDFGSKINLIRANYGRFSITQCNEQGQLDLSTDCMSPITFRIMQERCQDKQKCSVNATSSIFGDKCPRTRKYLEVHFQCQPDPRVAIEPPDRVDLRNQSSLMNQPPSISHVVYPQASSSIGVASGSSSILPPNNPTFGVSGPYQQSSARPIPHQTVSSTTSSMDEAFYVQSPQKSMSRTQPMNAPQSTPLLQQQPPQQQQQQSMTVMNSEILSYNSISDQNKPQFNPNNISSEPIIVTLRHTHTENMSNPRCVLWDPAASQWTERGSQIIESNSTHTICAFDQATSYLLVMDYLTPYPTVSQVNPVLIQNQQQTATQPSVPQIGSPYPGILDLQPVVLDPQQSAMSKNQQNSNIQQQSGPSANSSSSIVRFFSLFGYLLAFVFVAVAFMTIAFIASSMRTSTGAALKSLGNFTAFGGPKYKGRRADGALHSKDLLVINNQNGHQFLYAPASTTKINSSSSTHILTGGNGGQHQGTLHHIQQQQQQQQMYSGNGTLSNLSGTGGQSNNYYYGLMGLTNLFQHQQQSQQQTLQQHLSQHHLNQQPAQHQQMNHQQMTQANYHHQANKSTISDESSHSTPSSSGVESGSTGMQQPQQQQQASCLLMNNEYNLMGHVSNYGQHQNNLLNQPTLTLNAHYSTSGVPMNMTASQMQHHHHQQLRMNQNPAASMREHIYECVDDDKPYTARLLLPTNLNPSDQFNSNTLGQHQSMNIQHQTNPSRALTLSSRLLQSAMQPQQQQANNQANKRLFSHSPAIIRDNQAKTNIICSKMAQVTPQRATEINSKFQHEVMAIYNSSDTTTTTTTTNASNSTSNSSSTGCYGRPDLNGIGMNGGQIGGKLSTDC